MAQTETKTQIKELKDRLAEESRSMKAQSLKAKLKKEASVEKVELDEKVSLPEFYVTQMMNHYEQQEISAKSAWDAAMQDFMKDEERSDQVDNKLSLVSTAVCSDFRLSMLGAVPTLGDSVAGIAVSSSPTAV